MVQIKLITRLTHTLPATDHSGAQQFCALCLRPSRDCRCIVEDEVIPLFYKLLELPEDHERSVFGPGRPGAGESVARLAGQDETRLDNLLSRQRNVEPIDRGLTNAIEEAKHYQ